MLSLIAFHVNFKKSVFSDLEIAFNSKIVKKKQKFILAALSVISVVFLNYTL